MVDRFYLVILFGFLAICFSFTSEQYQRDLRNRRIVCVLLCILFIVQAGFRDYLHQVTDTINYANSYYNIADIPISRLIDDFSIISKEYAGRDSGYDIIVKVTQLIKLDFRFFLVLVATIISIPLCRIFYKYSISLSGIFIAACLYEALFAGFFETGIRQTISMGMTFIALDFYQNKKYWATITMTFIAFTIHSTALVFVPVYFMLRYKNTKRILICAILLTPLFMVNAKQILFALGEGTIISGYTSLTTRDNLGTPVFSAMVVLAVLLTSLYARKIRENYKYFDLMYITMACAIMLVPTTWVNSNFLRLELYFLVFLMPLLSVFIDVFTQKNSALATKYYIAIASLLGILSY